MLIYSTAKNLKKNRVDADDVSHVTVSTLIINSTGGQMKQQLGKIPLVIGMPVLIPQNFDVPGGVVNDCAGTYKIQTGQGRSPAYDIMHH
jgi:hypothetical protein